MIVSSSCRACFSPCHTPSMRAFSFPVDTSMPILPPSPQLPYVVVSEDDADELYNLTVNEAVKDLRDQYKADLVVLVGVFPDTCGRG